MAWSPTQPKKRDNKEQWGWELEVTVKWEGWGWTKFEKGGVEGRQYREVPCISSKNCPSFPLQPFLKNLAWMHFHIPQNSFQHHTKYQIPSKWKIWGKKPSGNKKTLEIETIFWLFQIYFTLRIKACPV